MALRRGRPKALAFSGLFLPSLEWELNVEEIPLRALEEDPKAGTAVRNLRRQQGQPIPKRLPPKLRGLIEQAPHSDEKAKLLRALDGDESALKAVDRMGPWTCVYAGGLTAWPQPQEYARLEVLSCDADEALARDDFAAASALVRRSPDLKLFWSEAALGVLANSQSAAEALVPRLAAYLELQMSCLALTSVQSPYAWPHQYDEGEFQPVIQSDGVPGRHLMRYLLSCSGLSSQAQMLDAAAPHIASDEELPSPATFKRWFSGQIFPPQNAVAPLLMALVQAAQSTRFAREVEEQRIPRDPKRLFLAARRVNSALMLADILLREGQNRHLLSAETSGEWAVASYRRWVSQWQGAPVSGLSPSGLVIRSL